MKTKHYLINIISILFFCSFYTISSAQNNDVRLNRTIELLAQGKPTFGIFSGDRSLNNARSLARSNLDFVLIDMEHGPLDFETLRIFLLSMTDKRSIIQKGNLQANVTPIVRLPVNGRENLQFLSKQALDIGSFGVMYPFISTKEEALNAVRASRYPQKKGAADFNPPGLRGRAPTNAVWYWGLTSGDYVRRADVWPLDPNGEILTVIQIENPEGVNNIEEIISVPGIGAIFVGYPDNPGAPVIEEAIQKVLKACKKKNIPVGSTTGPGSIERRLKEGFRFVTVGGDGGISPGTATTLQRGRTASGRK